MPGTDTNSVTETRQQAQLVEEHGQADSSSTIPPQVTTNEAVNTTPVIPPQEPTGVDDTKGFGQNDNYKSLGVSASGSLPLSETAMNTRINAGETTEGVPGTQWGGRLRVIEDDAVGFGPTAPHITPWLPSSAPQLYASPLAYPMMSTQPNAAPLPPGFQAYAPVIPESRPRRSPSPPIIPPVRSASPPQRFQTYIPVAPASQPLPGASYGPSPFAPRSVPVGRWGYEQSSESPYYPARRPIERRREVYVAQDPFHKRNQPKSKPSRVPYNPYAPADGIGANAGPFTPLPTPYGGPDYLPPTRYPEYPMGLSPSWYQPHKKAPRKPTYDSQTSNTPYAPMPYPPVWSQPPVIPSPYQRQETYDSQRSNDHLHMPGAIPGSVPGPNILPVQPSGGVFIPIPHELEEEHVTAGLEPLPPPSPRSSRSSERHSPSPISPAHSARSDRSPRRSRSYSPASPTYSSASPTYSPASPTYSPASPTYSPASPVPPSLPADAGLPSPHSVSPASTSVVSLSSASPPVSSVYSAPSPTTPTQAPSIVHPASLSSKRSYTPDDASRYSFSNNPMIPPVPAAPMIRPTFLPHYPSDVEKLESRPYRSSRLGIGRVIPETLRSWGRSVSRWATPGRRHHRPSSRPVIYAQDEENEYASASDEKSSFMATVVEFTTRRVPTDLYLVFLLFLPSFYFSRVARLFEEAELAMPEIEQMAIRTSLQAQNFLDEQVPGGQDVFPLQWIRLKSTWEHFIDSLLREWKTLNVISALLLSAILTILQIDDAANDYLTRYTALLSFICSLVSLLFGCIYIIRFATMRKTYKAAEWAMEAQESGTSTWWNVFILLALPSIWLTWSILLYVACIMSYIWRTAANVQESPPPLSDLTVLKIRIGISILLGLALVYACFILATFRRYGRAMDMKWAARIDNWRLGSMYPVGGPPPAARWDSPYPYASYPGGSMLGSVPRDIDRERPSFEKPQVRFRDRESDVPRMSAPNSPANVPYPRGEPYRESPVNPRERSTGSYDIYRSDFSSQQPPPVPSTPDDTVGPLGLTGMNSGSLTQTPYLPRITESPLQHSRESSQSSVRDMQPSVTSSASLSLQRYGSPSSHLADAEPPSGYAASVVEDQPTPIHEHTEPFSPGTTAAQPSLPELAPDMHTAQATHVSRQDTHAISSSQTLSHSGDTISTPEFV